jgi:hypothetical protein
LRLALAAGLLCLAATVCVATPVQWTVASGGNDHWYEAVKATANIAWTEAQAACEARGGHLVTLTSAAENAYVFSLVDSAPYWAPSTWQEYWYGPWIGARQPNPQPSDEPGGGWAWVTGEAWGYTNWSSTLDNWETEDYGQYFGLWSEGRGAKWNDYDGAFGDAGESPQSYVVEWDEANIPEPSSLALALVGLGPLVLRRRRGRA